MITNDYDTSGFKEAYLLFKVKNVYTMEKEKIAELANEEEHNKKRDYLGTYSFCGFNDYIYMKDLNNNIFKISLDDYTKQQIVSPDDIAMDGKSFLSDNMCSGLQMTNSGGFITYDHADNMIKYVEPNS